MASSSEEYTVPESRNENQVWTKPGVRPTKCVLDHFHEYGRDRPGVVALWCLGIGFILGWKLKRW